MLSQASPKGSQGPAGDWPVPSRRGLLDQSYLEGLLPSIRIESQPAGWPPGAGGDCAFAWLSPQRPESGS